jgi:hypothetical protein
LPHRYLGQSVERQGGWKVFLTFLLLVVGIPSIVGWIFAAAAGAMAARGTRPRYVLATVERTLRYPAIIARLMFLTIGVMGRDWASVAWDSAGLAFMVVVIWKLGDHDDFWTGKGKKLKKWARSQFSGSTRLAPMPT